MKRFWVLLLFFISLSVAQAQPDKVYQVKESELTEQQKAKLQSTEIKDNVSSWTGLGKEVGTAMKEGLSALNSEVNSFSQSPAGKFTMFIIAYKVIGKDLVRYAVAVPLYFFGLLVFIWFYYKDNVPHKVLTKKTGKFFSREKTYELVDNGTEGQKFAYFICFAAFLAITSLIAFA